MIYHDQLTLPICYTMLQFKHQHIRSLGKNLCGQILGLGHSLSQVKDTRLSSICKKGIKTHTHTHNKTMPLPLQFLHTYANTQELGERKLKELCRTRIRGILCFLFYLFFKMKTSQQESPQGELPPRPKRESKPKVRGEDSTTC